MRGVRRKGMSGYDRPRSEAIECCSRSLLTMAVASSFLLPPSSLSWGAHPFVTDDTGTQGTGNWQLELQADFLRSDRTVGAVERKSRLDVFSPVLSYGILDNLDLQLGLNYLSARVTDNGALAGDESGMGDSSMELKWRFYDVDGLSFALKPSVLLATGDEDKGLGTGKTSWGIALVATYEAEPWAFLGNVAYAELRFKDAQAGAHSRSDLWLVSAGAAYAFSGELRLVGELGLRSNESRNDPFQPDRTSQFGMLGAIYSPTRKVDLDIGFRKNFNQAELDKAYLVGATFRW